ncbi:unnamed protein product [Sphagnum balticum]
MEIKIQVIICNRHLDYLPCTSLPLARLSNNKQVNRLEGYFSPTFAKLSKYESQIPSCSSSLQNKKNKKKKHIWNTTIPN